MISQISFFCHLYPVIGCRGGMLPCQWFSVVYTILETVCSLQFINVSHESSLLRCLRGQKRSKRMIISLMYCLISNTRYHLSLK